MIKITDGIYIGNSKDEVAADYSVKRDVIDSVLVVACDMVTSNGWDDKVEYMQVGLIDGPGNPLAAYHAAVLALAALRHRGRVLICCHDGGRALAIVIMYLYMTGNGPSWDEAVARLATKTDKLPKVHEAHRKAFFLMDWSMLARVVDGEV